MNYLVSIIIPTYNRGHLIKETLDSIIAQTYLNWECIIVDDGSTDNTLDILAEYSIRDCRFKFYKRPINKTKGANACRNFGFEKSIGDYINWFDSDDIMFPEFIEIKLKALINNTYDYVISRSLLFEEKLDHINEKYNYTFHKHNFTHYNFVSHKINWLTPDLMVCRSIVENKIFFNEKLKTTAQEYNFFCKLTANTINGHVLKDFLIGYRQHPDSIEAHLNQNKKIHSLELCKAYYLTILDLENRIEENVSIFLHESILRRSFDVKLPIRVLNKIFKYLFIKSNLKISMAYVFYQLIFKTFEKGHFFRKYFLKLYKFQTKW